MKNKNPLCLFALFLKEGKNFKVILFVPNEKIEVPIIAAETITRVNPNSAAVKILGKSNMVFTAPIITPMYDVIKFKTPCLETVPIIIRS